MNEIEMMALLEEAEEMRSHAYAPYSRFAVGAALLCEDGSVYGGCNIENGSYGATVCAERTAFFKAVSEGAKDFKAIAITGAPKGEASASPCPPCGICRQVMAEFCDPKTFLIILRDGPDKPKTFTLGDLLPESFTL